jgi:hypothetical protein
MQKSSWNTEKTLNEPFRELDSGPKSVSNWLWIAEKVIQPFLLKVATLIEGDNSNFWVLSGSACDIYVFFKPWIDAFMSAVTIP